MARAMIWGGGAFGALGLICCFTPLLPIVLGGLGLTGLLSLLYQDAVLLPLAAIGFVVAGIGVWRIRRGG
jgi:mercuric ion transport protein